MGVGNEKLLGPDDDNFHPAPDDNWWWHETCWFWFFVPDRKLGGWLYNYVRPNIGVAGGGCWVWDDTAHSILEVPYYANYSNLPLPEERDLRNFKFPSGTVVEVLEPLKRYRLAIMTGRPSLWTWSSTRSWSPGWRWLRTRACRVIPVPRYPVTWTRWVG